MMSYMMHICHAHSEFAIEGTHMTSIDNIEIFIDQPIDELLQSSPIAFEQDCLAPAKVCWYKIRKHLSSSQLPSVTVRKASSTLLEIQNVGSVSIVIDENLGPQVRAVDMAIRGLPDDSPHAEQKTFISQLLQGLLAAGWNHFYNFSAARISGTEADKLTDAKHVLGKRVSAHPWFDPRQEFSLEHWLKVDSFFNWYFHRDGHYLQVTAQRSNSRIAPLERGTYLISLELMSESSYWRQHFEQKQKDSWQQLLPELLEQYRQDRAALEEKARAAGIEIEEDYQNPPIQALAAGAGQH